MLAGLEELAFGAAMAAALLAVGAGVTRLLLPNEPRALLIAPAAGLAIMVVAFQFLTFVVPPFVTAALVVVAGAVVTAAVYWRRRATTAWDGWDLAAAGAIGLAFFVGLMQMDMARGYLTLGGLVAALLVVGLFAPAWLRPVRRRLTRRSAR